RSAHGEERRHGRHIGRVTCELEATESEILLNRLQQGEVIVWGRVLKPTRSVTGDHDRCDLPASIRAGSSAATRVVIALLVGYHDRVVALRPERSVRDRADRLAQSLIADRDQTLVLGITRVATIDAVRGITVHVMTLVRNDVAERRHVARGKIVTELIQRHLARP